MGLSSDKKDLYQVGAGNCRKCDGIVIMYNWLGWEYAECPHCGKKGGVTEVVRNLTVKFVDTQNRYAKDY